MKVIISHDVDALFRNDHYHDLIYPKQQVRCCIKLIKGECTFNEWILRLTSPFKKRQNNIKALMEFDKCNNIESTFFFGMAKGLGMSYSKEKPLAYTTLLKKNGFDVGVHGISFDDYDLMKKERDDFIKTIGFMPEGIRMHYVRFNDSTFKLLSKVGYLFDSTEFDKKKGYLIKSPYKVNGMWEFPLTIMDGYLPEKFGDMQLMTKKIIKEAEQSKLEYITILLHDPYFCDAFSAKRDWYLWLIDYLKSKHYTTISFTKAIRELEEG